MTAHPHEITTDGRTVWVNVPGGCIGRFGLQGIDIHRLLEAQVKEGECLFCTHGPVTADDWPVFVTKMREHHGIEVSDCYRPTRFR